MLFLPTVVAQAASPTIAVLYPQTTAPYQSFIETLLGGIDQSGTSLHLEKKSLGEAPDLEEVRAWLARIEPQVIITLGRVPTETYDRLQVTISRVIGAYDISPQVRPDTAGISLAVDPVLLLARLKRVVPTVQQVWVVFDPRTDQWLIDLARERARALGLTLQALEAIDFTQATAHFQALWAKVKTQTDAVWLLNNASLVDSQTILPFLIEQSWKRQVVLFSSSLYIAKRGTLFALYPNPAQLGRALGQLTADVLQHPKKRFQLQPLRTVSSVVNLKVAAHLSLKLTQEIEGEFDEVLPPW